jgi:hypothetical protein
MIPKEPTKNNINVEINQADTKENLFLSSLLKKRTISIEIDINENKIDFWGTTFIW